ncbi:hypothetical protein AVEN_185887-1 [Araneus ventricosus]|uniref:Uncharacterized protein n=1 Tax=Araneus ventricosus TaxID=182803 RepID=A0A4Y2PGD2_ARAVE|nr:hypothetical protein AVEN_185887-1 [Araneus ventricosus]
MGHQKSLVYDTSSMSSAEEPLTSILVAVAESNSTPGPLRASETFFLRRCAVIRSAALGTWQGNWDIGETGRSAHNIAPRVSNKPIGWNREEIMFVTGHGPFPSYCHRFNLRIHGNCSCGQKEEPMHYATKCRFILFWHFQTPTVSLKLQWLKNILPNNSSRTRLRLLMRFVCDENNLLVEDNH